MTPLAEDGPATMLRPAEAAELLGISHDRVRSLAARGRITGVRTLGGHHRYRLDDILAVGRWLDRQG